MRRSRTLAGGWISRFATLIFAALIGFALVTQDAEARRLGGGKSFGRQSPNATRQAAPPTREAPPQAAPAPQPQPQPAGNRWLGPIAGIAAGLGIAALLSHFGMAGAFAEGLGSILVIVLLVVGAVLVWRLLRGGRGLAPASNRVEPAYSAPGMGGASAPVNAYAPVAGAAMPGSVAALSSSSGRPPGVPADFDIADFLRNAKVYFIRLQAAWDEKNFADIREFTTPEVFAEIKMQIDEEKGAQNRTDVGELEGELLGIEENASDYLASVRFKGKISENGAPATPFEEVWNLSKAKDGRSGWLLAGIQQIQ